MKRYPLILITALLPFLFSTTAFSQDSNLKEDYTAFIPEANLFNKMLLQNQQPGTVLIKEGLAKERNLMKTFAPARTILQPTQQNITGPGGSIRLVSFNRSYRYAYKNTIYQLALHTNGM